MTPRERRQTLPSHNEPSGGKVGSEPLEGSWAQRHTLWQCRQTGLHDPTGRSNVLWPLTPPERCPLEGGHALVYILWQSQRPGAPVVQGRDGHRNAPPGEIRWQRSVSGLRGARKDQAGAATKQPHEIAEEVTGCYPSLSEREEEMEPVQSGSAACSMATNKHRAKAAASHQHRWAALEHHRGHLYTFHLLTKESLPPLTD
ncbi:hypothetical protein Q7C36_023529 [Tachysurus vachellii]|uniref:Uncharacterized protein n=1 Tax=Tachysurus vachellii TaxID=175792 RepID=A0AA88LFI5_TACVA|nr:hypothetical protein Q7C36_023529 [Tachysurus vachellii]